MFAFDEDQEDFLWGTDDDIIEPEWLVNQRLDELLPIALGESTRPLHLSEDDILMDATLGASHPNGRWHTVEVYDWFSRLPSYKIVRETATRSIIWNPQNAKDIAWIRQGSEIVLLRDTYSSSSYSIERYTWPERQLRSFCSVVTAFPGPERFVVSPRGNLLAVQWWHQGEEGFEFIALNDADGDFQLKEPLFPRDALLERSFHRAVMSGFPVDNQVAGRAIFSLSGRFMIFGQKPPEPHTYDESEINGNVIGSLVILDWDAKTARKQWITHGVPYYYTYGNQRIATNGIRSLECRDDAVCVVELGTGELRQISLIA
jgi:hypothetical protein